MSRISATPLDHDHRRPWHLIGVIVIVVLLYAVGDLEAAADMAAVLGLLLTLCAGARTPERGSGMLGA